MPQPNATAQAPVWLECPPFATFSPEWLSRSLASAAPGCRVQSATLDPVTIGTTNHYRARLTYASGEGPESIFIKCQGRLGKRLLLGVMGLLTPETLALGAGQDLAMETPRVFAAGIDHTRLDSILVMEDLALRGASMNIVTRPFTIERIYCGLDQLAKLHGRFWHGLPPNLACVKPWKMLWGWKLLALLAGAKGVPKMRRFGVVDMIPPELHPWQQSLWLIDNAIRLSSQGPQTLIHGDTHVGNTYDLPNGDLGFVDWQCVHTGSWERDVGYFMMCGMEVEDRRRHEKEMLRYYLDALARAGGTPPPWDDVWDDYRSCPAYGLIAWISTLAGDDYQPDAVNLKYIERFGAAYKDLETGRRLRGE